MRILLTHKFHHVTGGAEVFYFEVARVLKKNGHKIAYFSTENILNISSEDKLYTVDSPNYRTGNVIKRILDSRDIFFSKKNKDAMLKAIDEFQPDIIHAFAIHIHLTPSILEAAKEKRIPVVMSCNDYKHICPNYKLFSKNSICESCAGYKYFHAVTKKCSKNSILFSVASAVEAYVHEGKHVYDRMIDKYLFASEFMLNKTKEFWSDKDVNYGILKNPFNFNDYSPVFKGEYALYFGRIVEEKGVDLIISAAKEASEVSFKIIGDGPSLCDLQDEVRKSGILNVEYLGTMWGSQLKEMLAGARFIIVPSKWHENYPYVILQSFASGKPVIGSMRGGISELIGDERGLLFDPDDIGELVSSIKKLWSDPHLCRDIGYLVRKYVETKFTEEIFYNSLMENYWSVLN